LKEIDMCDSNVGVAKRIELESISKDLQKLIKQLDDEVEGKIQVLDIRKIEKKLSKIVAK
jgi:hypothetical protein